MVGEHNHEATTFAKFLGVHSRMHNFHFWVDENFFMQQYDVLRIAKFIFLSEL